MDLIGAAHLDGPQRGPRREPPPSLEGGARVWGARQVGPTRVGRPPLGRRPCPSLPLYIVGVWGRGDTAKVQPPLLSPTAFSPSHVATPPRSCDSHAWSCTCRWSCTIRTPSCCRCVGPKEIFFRKPRLDRGWRTSSLPDVYEYSGTPYFRPSGVVRGAS